MGRIEVGARVNIRRSADTRDRRSRKSRDPSSPPPAADVILRIPADEAKQLQKRAQNLHARQGQIVAEEINALKAALDRESMTKTRATRKTPGQGGDKVLLEKSERDERQLDHWRAAREAVRLLKPSESISDALEVLHLDPLIRTLQHLESISETQVDLSELRLRCQDMRKELRRMEHQISEAQRMLEEKDDWIRRRAWRSFKHGHESLEKFDVE